MDISKTISTKEFVYNKFLKNPNSLEDYLPRGIFLRNVGKKSENQIEYCSKCKLFANEIYIKCLIRSNYMAVLINSSSHSP